MAPITTVLFVVFIIYFEYTNVYQYYTLNNGLNMTSYNSGAIPSLCLAHFFTYDTLSRDRKYETPIISVPVLFTATAAATILSVIDATGNLFIGILNLGIDLLRGKVVTETSDPATKKTEGVALKYFGSAAKSAKATYNWVILSSQDYARNLPTTEGKIANLFSHAKGYIIGAIPFMSPSYSDPIAFSHSNHWQIERAEPSGMTQEVRIIFARAQHHFTVDQMRHFYSERDPEVLKAAMQNMTFNQINDLLTSFCRTKEKKDVFIAGIQSLTPAQLVGCWTNKPESRRSSNGWFYSSLFNHLSDEQIEDLKPLRDSVNADINKIELRNNGFRVDLFDSIGKHNPKLFKALLDVTQFENLSPIASLGYALPEEETSFLFDAYISENQDKPINLFTLARYYLNLIGVEQQSFPSRYTIEHGKLTAKRILLNWPVTEKHFDDIEKLYQERSWTDKAIKPLAAYLLLMRNPEHIHVFLDEGTVKDTDAMLSLIKVKQSLPVDKRKIMLEAIWKACPKELLAELIEKSFREFVLYDEEGAVELRKGLAILERDVSREAMIETTAHLFSFENNVKNHSPIFLGMSKALRPLINVMSEQELCAASKLIQDQMKPFSDGLGVVFAQNNTWAFLDGIPVMYPSIVKMLLPIVRPATQTKLCERLFECDPNNFNALLDETTVQDMDALIALIKVGQSLSLNKRRMMLEAILKACPIELLPQLIVKSVQLFLKDEEGAVELRKGFAILEKDPFRWREVLKTLVDLFNLEGGSSKPSSAFYAISNILQPMIRSFQSDKILEALGTISNHTKRVEFVKGIQPTAGIIKLLMLTADTHQRAQLNKDLVQMDPNDPMSLEYLKGMQITEENIKVIYKAADKLTPMNQAELILKFGNKKWNTDDAWLILMTLETLRDPTRPHHLAVFEARMVAMCVKQIHSKSSWQLAHYVSKTVKSSAWPDEGLREVLGALNRETREDLDIVMKDWGGPQVKAKVQALYNQLGIVPTVPQKPQWQIDREKDQKYEVLFKQVRKIYDEGSMDRVPRMNQIIDAMDAETRKAVLEKLKMPPVESESCEGLLRNELSKQWQVQIVIKHRY